MEFEEIGKRLEWLDEQQRTIKTELRDLTGRSNSFESSVNVLAQQLKMLDEQMNALSPAAARINQFDQFVARQRTDIGKTMEAMEKTVRSEQESLKLHHGELAEIRKTVFQLSQALATEEPARKERAHEEQRRTLAAQDTRAAAETAIRQGKEILEAQNRLDETQRQDAKHLADLHAEMSSVRKRTDEMRETTTLHADELRNIQNRINDLLETESSRQERQAAVVQKQALAQVERDRTWKEWQEKYDLFRQQAASVDSQVAAFDDAIRAAQRAQEAYNDLNQKLERRIAEVAEMQRLGEDRVRQEWVAFKAEEQKRWAGYSLSQDETTRELRKDVDAIDGRLTSLDDMAETLQDQLQQTTETTEKQLQELMNVAHDWLSAYERIMGHARTKNRKSAQ